MDFFNRQRTSVHSNQRYRSKQRGETPAQQLEMQTYLGGEPNAIVDEVDDGSSAAFHKSVLLSSSSDSDEEDIFIESDYEDDTFSIDKTTGEWRGASASSSAQGLSSPEKKKRQQSSSWLAWFSRPTRFRLNRESGMEERRMSEESRVLLLDEDELSTSESEDENSHFRIG